MGKLIKEDSGARGVNFQKASCTLDASVKIYSHRVDDTYASSHRILESLSRNGGGEDENGTTERAAARVGTKSASNRLNIAETIERNPECLNSVKVDSEHATDPMFHKMSKAFDEGGARGMLMNNLRVTQGTCSLVFTSDGLLEDPTSEQEPVSPLVDISDLVFKCGFALSDLSGLTICPTLADYRKTMGVEEVTSGCYAGPVVSRAIWGDCSSSSGAGLPIPQSNTFTVTPIADDDVAPLADYASADYDDGNDCGAAYDDAGNDEHDDCDDEGNYIASNRRASMAGGPCMPMSRKSMGGPGSGPLDEDIAPAQQTQTHKIAWDDGQTDGQASAAVAPIVWEGMGQGTTLTEANDYAFFDLDALAKSNLWAGARHWRYATRRREPVVKEVKNSEENDEENDAKEPAGKKSAASKSKKIKGFSLTFGPTAVQESLFAVPTKSRGDSTMLTTAAIEKDNAKADLGELYLPVDSKLQARDLCRLNLCPSMIVPPSMLAHMLKPTAESAARGDFIWGQVRQTPSSSGPIGATYNDYDDDEDDGYGGVGYDDDMDVPADYTLNAPAQDSTATASAPIEVPEGLALQSGLLLQAGRVVEKLEIGYATTAKRVNVRKLKGDLWGHISAQVGDTNAEDAGEENMAGYKFSKSKVCSSTEKSGTALSFQEVVNDLAQEQKQSEVTLPFYFICLLHLANEKVNLISMCCHLM